MKRDDAILVAGAGGFIGGHLVRRLRKMGFADIRGVDIKPLTQWHQLDEAVDNISADLSRLEACTAAVEGIDLVFNLASDMGGMGYIETHKTECMLSVLINTHLLMAAREMGAQRYFFASSACVYAAEKQHSEHVQPLKESDAYPADPEDGYGWEKLFSERMCRHFREDFGLETRVARFHNIYGPFSAFRGGREKAPAAICRKVIEAQLNGVPEIEIWGDGRQTRSFTYIDDCIEGMLRLTDSDVIQPLNVGSSELVSIDQLVSLVEDIANVRLTRRYSTHAPKGVRGRNSDNARVRELLGWEPSIRLADGLRTTYGWIRAEMERGG